MAPQSPEIHPVGSNDSNKTSIVRDDCKSPSIELSLGIGFSSSPPPLMTSQSIWPCAVPLQSVMDFEPGRCRRTDGRKWRCRRDVLPDQKYCERHIHRGRQRSRKTVESQTVSVSKSTTTKSNSSAVKAVANLQSSTKDNIKDHSNVRIKNDRSSKLDLSYVNGQSLKIKKGGRENVKNRGYGDRVPLEFSFSPKSVLRHSNARGGGTSSNDHSTLVGAESQRCRRTDGKKWRCTRDVLPEQKYCAQHMHRGAKRFKIVENCQKSKSNTHLSFSVGASYQRMGNDENLSSDSSSSNDVENDPNPNGVSSSSSSEATTITM